MYVPKQFREERTHVLARAIRRIQLATLITPGADGLQISHLPMVLKGDEAGGWTLEAHVARANPHWRHAGPDAASVAVFQGPQAYVSPSWYASKREHGRVVPTWNYIAVHVSGRLEPVQDEAWLLGHLGDVTDANEAGREHPWAVTDAPGGFVRGLARAIVGLRMAVSGIEGAWKLIQHKPEADRLGAMAGLDGEPHGAEIAELMRQAEAARE